MCAEKKKSTATPLSPACETSDAVKRKRALNLDT